MLAAVPFIQYSGAGIIAIAATGMIYLSYFLGNIVILRARLRGWPKTSAPFRLGRWGLLVNVLGLLYGGAMLINFAWPRAASNPKPNQTGGLLSFGIGFLNNIPDPVDRGVVIALIGAIYYLAAGRRKEFAPVIAPAGDDAPLVTEAGTPPGRVTGEPMPLTVDAAHGAGQRRRCTPAGARGGAGDPWPGATGDHPGPGCHRARPDRGLAGRGDRGRPLRPGRPACRPSRTWPPGSGSAG